MNVEAYLQHFKDFDCLSCNWVTVLMRITSPPLSRDLDFRLKSNVKSFVAYQSILSSCVVMRLVSAIFARVLDAAGNPQT